MSYYIYCITNDLNGKTYIGQRFCPKEKTPETDLYMGSGELIKKAIKKYGLINFSKTILESEIETKKDVDKREIYWISEYKKIGKAEYNISMGGTGGNLGEEVCKKARQTKIKIYEECPELRVMISVKMKTILNDPLIRDKMSKSHKEAMNRPEVIEKCRKSHIGQKVTKEQKKKISQSLKGKNVWSKGKKLSEETKRKIMENNAFSKKVYCVELNLIFNSIRQAGLKLNLDTGSISRCCKGCLHTVGGYHWKYI